MDTIGWKPGIPYPARPVQDRNDQVTAPLRPFNAPLRQDTFSRQEEIKPKPALRFGQGPSDSDEELLESFPRSFAQVVNNARQIAESHGQRTVRAEHLVLAMMETVVNTSRHEYALRSRNPKDVARRRTQATMMLKALMPQFKGSFTEAGQILSPIVERAREELRAQRELSPKDSVPLQPALRDLLKTAAESAPNKEALPAIAIRQMTSKAMNQPNSPFSSGVALLSAIPAVRPADDEMEMDDSTTIGSASDGSLDLKARLEEKSPMLARWFKPTSAQHHANQDSDFGSLPQAMLRGVDTALRAYPNRNQKGNNRPPAASQVSEEALQAFLGAGEKERLSRAQATMVLTNAQRKLKEFERPIDPQAIRRASQASEAILADFLDASERQDFSPAAFIAFLKQKAANADSSADPAAAVGQVLEDMVGEASDQRMLNAEQFEKECPSLMRFSTNLVRKGMRGELPGVYLRREATERMLALINSPGQRTNILLNTASGEGKTFAAMGLAQRIANNDVPKELQGAQMAQLDIASLLSASPFEGDLERNTKAMLDQLSRYLDQHPKQKVVLFIDEMHMLAPRDGSTRVLDLFKASGILEKKNLTFIGATTPEDWKKSAISNDNAFLGRFHTVALPPFAKDEQLTILGMQARQIERQQQIDIPPELVEQALRQAGAKWPENTLRRSQDLLGLAVSLADTPSLEQANLRDKLQAKELWLQTLGEKQTLKGRFKRQKEQLPAELAALRQDVDKHGVSSSSEAGQTLKEKHLKQALAILTGQQLGVISKSELEKLRHAKDIMAESIVGQPEALATVQEGLREIAVRHKTGVIRNRPVVSMLLAGPTGVGKTETGKVIAKEFMNGNFFRLDMSLYKDKHSISSLLGTSPGYVGYEDGGLLDRIRKAPQSVVVFDEIEKAHKDIFDVLLPILDEGEIADNQGNKINFRDTVVILTSNLQQAALNQLIQKHRAQSVGKDSKLAGQQLDNQVRKLLTADPERDKPGFLPEHLGRMDYVIPYNPLTGREVSHILDIRLREMNQEAYLKDNNLEVALTDEAKQRLIALTAGLDGSKGVKLNEDTPLQGGAREVRNAFERHIYKKVFADLAYEPELDELENARLVVDYPPNAQSFTLRVEPKGGDEMMIDAKPLPFHGPRRGGKTLAFA